MIKHEIDYLVEGKYGNQVHITDQELNDFRLIHRENQNIEFIYKNRRYQAVIQDYDKSLKKLRISINNHILNLTLSDQLDQLTEKMGLSEVVDEVGGDIHSPMPGLVVKILVSDGDQVKKGEALMILEAMKMENLLQASADGVVREIKVKAGSSVEKGQLLITME